MNSEQVSFESFAEAGERLCGPDIGRSSFHHCGPKIEKSCGLADGPLVALSDGGTRRPAEVVERRDGAGVCGLTNAWR